MGAIVSIVRIQAVTTGGAAVGASETHFVAEQISDEGTVIGRVAHLTLNRNIGSEVPRYWYYVGQVAFSSQELPLYRRDRMLVLGNDLIGIDELSGIACELAGASERECQQAKLALIQAVLHLRSADGVRGNPRVTPRLIVELSGQRIGERSPFWDGLGRHFCPMDPEKLGERFGRAWDSHVAALMPQQPLLVSLLSEGAQVALAEVGEAERGLEEVLRGSGFRCGRHVSIHDGGPVYEYDDDATGDPHWHAVTVRALDRLESDDFWLLRGDNDRTVWLVPAKEEGQVLTLDAVAARLIQTGPAMIQGRRLQEIV